MLDETHHLVLETLEMNKQALVFAPSRASAEKTAEELSKLTSFNLPELEKEVLKALSQPTKQCRRLSHCIRKGIAFHHSGLTSDQKELIEEEFRKGKVKVICCTPTLAAGISTPAFRVIIKSLKRFSDQWGMDWIPVLEYMQMSGRAGRPEYESFGEAIIIAKDEGEREEVLERYIRGVPEDIYSKLAVEPVLRTYLLSLISSGIIHDAASLKEFFEHTFWAHQFKDLPRLEAIMEKMLQLLEAWQMVQVIGEVTSKPSDFVAANHLQGLKQRKLKPTLLGKRVSELYLDPLTARHLLDGLKNYTSDKKTFSLLQLIAHTLELRPLLRVRSKDEEEVQDKLTQNYDQLLEKEPPVFDPEYDEFINSIKTTLFLEEWINEADEDYLLEKYDIRPGEIKVKLDIVDWLLYACEELGKVIQLDHPLIADISKLRIRIKYGVKDELLTLLKLRNIGRVRARKLVLNGIKDLGDLKKTDVSSLTQILGSRLIAEDVLKQVGEDVPKKISDHKRKGQMSLGKY
ncbi:MAG: helicase-related protein [Candidatus Woesearchaeota archaeon]